MTSAEGDNERFTVRSAVEVASIFRAVMRAGEMVTAHGGDGQILLVTKILQVDAHTDRVLFDAGKDAESNRRLVDGRTVWFVTSQDRVKIQFQSGQMRLTTHEGGPALQIAMPRSLLKFQRREYYRVDSPLTEPVRCRLMRPEGPVDAVVVDISLGGLLLAGYPNTMTMAPGMKFDGAQVDLGEAGRFSASLLVRNLSEVQLRNGSLSRRAGCMFIKLAPATEALLQRYIMRLERDRRAKGIDG